MWKKLAFSSPDCAFYISLSTVRPPLGYKAGDDWDSNDSITWLIIMFMLLPEEIMGEAIFLLKTTVW